MSKRILLAEGSETIRKIAESLLRQNGFEVLSVVAGAKALEILNFTSPDLILLASDMKFNSSTTLFDKLQNEQKTSQFPILLLANDGDNLFSLQPEAIIKKPFDPKEFIEKVNLFSGQTKPDHQNPLSANDVEDEFLDVALGLDKLDVTDSEVMGQTLTGKIKTKPSVEKLIGLDQNHDGNDDSGDSGKVESLMLGEDVTDIKHSNHVKPATPKDITGTGKLDILDDQFGIVSNELNEIRDDSADHDYNWFLDELANDNNVDKKDSQNIDSNEIRDSQKLKFQDNSTFVDPVTPSQVKQPSKSTSVDKFIDEFKKEVEKFGADEPESITLEDSKQKLSESGSVLQWTDSIEKITPQQIAIFKDDFVKELASKIAIQIADKIDADKLLQLLKQEITNKAKKL